MRWQWRKISFSNERGLLLSGLLYESETANPGYKPVVIVCHGFLGNKDGKGKAVAMAEELATATGWASFLFDFAGNGESQGDFCDLTLTNQIADLKAAVDRAQKLGLGPIITLGRSFGGTTVLCHAAMDARVRAVCTWSAVAFPKRNFSRRRARPAGNGLLRWDSTLGVTVYLKENFFEDLERYDVLDSTRCISPRPLLLCHGDQDGIVPVGDVHALWEAAAEPKQLLVVPGADHVYSDHYQQVWETFFNWVAGLRL